MSPAILTLPTPVRAQAARLSDKLQEKFEARLRCVQILTATPRSQLCATARQLAAELYPIHGQGFAPKTIMNLFRAYRKDGAEALLFGYSGNGLGEKPVEFIEHVRRRCEKNKRVASVEIDSIRSDWFSGTPLPGFGSWRDQWAARFPAEPVPAACPVWFQPQGFSSATLRRMLPSKAAMTIARRGHFAAHGLMPQKRNDYSQLRALECVVFDDVKTDWLVSIPGYDRPCELWLLVAMDAGCAHILDWVALAAVPDDEGKRHELLKEHMRCLVGQMILKYGIPTEYPDDVQGGECQGHPERGRCRRAGDARRGRPYRRRLYQHGVA
ncbi:MAG: hypothetical protein IPL39_14570 [Opitutaceae bacterium]|nr:hypothetical protein [Opitutaceae bacterium]